MPTALRGHVSPDMTLTMPTQSRGHGLHNSDITFLICNNALSSFAVPCHFAPTDQRKCWLRMKSRAIGDRRRRHALVAHRVHRQQLELRPGLHDPDLALLRGEIEPPVGRHRARPCSCRRRSAPCTSPCPSPPRNRPPRRSSSRCRGSRRTGSASACTARPASGSRRWGRSSSRPSFREMSPTAPGRMAMIGWIGRLPLVMNARSLPRTGVGIVTSDFFASRHSSAPVAGSYPRAYWAAFVTISVRLAVPPDHRRAPRRDLVPRRGPHLRPVVQAERGDERVAAQVALEDHQPS